MQHTCKKYCTNTLSYLQENLTKSVIRQWDSRYIVKHKTCWKSETLAWVHVRSSWWHWMLIGCDTDTSSQCYSGFYTRHWSPPQRSWSTAFQGQRPIFSTELNYHMSLTIDRSHRGNPGRKTGLSRHMSAQLTHFCSVEIQFLQKIGQ